MAKRQSYEAAGFGHQNPIPAAARVGPLVMSGVIIGFDPATGKPPPDLHAQVQFMFDHLERIVQASGCTMEEVVKVTVWMTDRTQRQALNERWVALFPNPQSRPARHTLDASLGPGILVQCDFTAYSDSK
jgi:enamine deaminase RidA (YjgF/YER057c/UK114 family)